MSTAQRCRLILRGSSALQHDPHDKGRRSLPRAYWFDVEGTKTSTICKMRVCQWGGGCTVTESSPSPILPLDAFNSPR